LQPLTKTVEWLSFMAKVVGELSLLYFILENHPPRSARHSYEFFLLYRPAEGGTAKTLASWTVPPEDIPYDYYLRGHLNYDPETDFATVMVADIEDKKTILTERVGLAKVIMEWVN
jgi:hypothetical protein